MNRHDGPVSSSVSLADPPPPDGASIAMVFGLGRVVEQPTFAARGELGRIWRMDTSSGTYAVKELFLDDPGDGREDVAFQLAAAGAGVPLPAPVATLAGDVICRVGDRRIRVYEWVDLDGDALVDDAAAGALLARIHLVGHPASATAPWYTDGVGEARWEDVVSQALASDADWAEPLADLVPGLLEAERSTVLPAARSVPFPLIGCHLDFNPQNVVVDMEGRAVVLDWENSGGGVPEREVVMALWEFGTVGDDDDVLRRAAAFVRGYRDAGGVFEARDGSVFAMAFAVQAHLLELFARRSLDEQSSDEVRARSDGWLREMVARPLTPGAAENLLAALA